MSESNEPQFLDTNILIYAFDASTDRKHEIAKALYEKLLVGNSGCTSLQILQEFFVSVVYKSPKKLQISEAREIIQNLAAWPVHRPFADDILAAIDLSVRYQISFWASMVIRSARQTGCNILWSEDLAHGQDYDGVLVQNPFAA